MRYRILLFSGLLLGTALLSSASELRRPRVRLGGVAVGVGYSSGYPGGYGSYPYWAGPAWSQWGPWYNPFWYGPQFYPGFLSTTFGPQMGRVRLRTPDKQDEVFINGGFAGNAGKLHSMYLDPGTYEVEIRCADGSSFSRKLYVLSGKTLWLDTRDM